jgi:hypothetical protein
VREDDPSPPVGERLVGDGIRRFNVCSWAFVYRKQVDESSDHPRRPGIRALDKPSLRTSGERSGSSILIWMRPTMRRDLVALLRELDVHARRMSHDHASARAG